MKLLVLLILIFSHETVFNQPEIIAHRGASADAPENTIAAFRKAVELGADYIEIDLRQSKDGELIVIHDGSVDRTTNGNGDVDELTFSELRKFDAGSWFDKKLNSEKIPSLQEVISLLGDSVQIIIEFKESNDSHPGFEEKVISLIKKNNLEQQTILKSFDPNVLERLRKRAPEIPLCYVYALRLPWLGLIIDTGISFGSTFDFDVEYLQPHRFFLSESFVKKAQSKGYKVIAWGVNSESAIREAIEFGVDGIETDHVERVRRLVEE